MEIFPVAQIFGAIEKNAAAGFELTGSDTKIPLLRFFIPPQKRIAKARELWVIRRLNDRFLPFVPSAQLRIGRGGEALHFAEIVSAISKRSAIRRNGFYSRIQDC